MPDAKSFPLITDGPIAVRQEEMHRKPYLVGLDALRAVAACSVCLFHFSGGMMPKLVVPAVKSALSQGYLGVDIFFVISGFIIPYSLLGKNHRITDFGAYMIRRLLRINPPAYVAIFLVLGQWFFIDSVINHSSQYTLGLSWWQLLNNLLFTIPFTEYKWINGVCWTLAIELQFYIFIGLFFSIMFARSIWWFVFVYVLISFVPSEKIGFIQYSSLFALGGTALLWQQRRISATLFGAGLLLFGVLIFYRFGMYAALVGITTSLAINTIKIKVAGLTLLGKISYSMYLVHGLIGTTMEFVLIKLLSPTTDARKLSLMAVCFLLAIVGSYGFYKLIEQPFLRLTMQNRNSKVPA